MLFPRTSPKSRPGEKSRLRPVVRATTTPSHAFVSHAHEHLDWAVVSPLQRPDLSSRCHSSEVCGFGANLCSAADPVSSAKTRAGKSASIDLSVGSLPSWSVLHDG